MQWENNDIDTRKLFYQLNQSGNNQDVMHNAYAFIVQRIKALDFGCSAIELNDDPLGSLKTPAIPPLSETLQTQDNLYTCINQTAATQLTQVCWLQNISQACYSQSDIAVQLMSLNLQLAGAGCEGTNIQQLYRALILTSGHEPPVLHSYDYSQQPEVVPEVYDFAVVQLALTRFPRVLLPEILGFTLAYCQTPTLLEVCFPHQQQALPFFKLHRQLAESQLQPLRSCILNYLGLFPEQQQPLWQRVQKGFWLYQRQMQICRDGLQKKMATPRTARQAMVQLLLDKAPVAIGHHQKVQLQGKTLDLWFAGLPANGNEFLLALTQSEYVNKKSPQHSRLLVLFDFKGPMFGVLDQSEIDIIKNWLNSGLEEGSPEAIEEQQKIVVSNNNLASVSRQLQKKYVNLSNRELYYYLVNADLFPDVLPVAQAKVRNRLRARALFNPLPFKHYSHQQFDAYIDTIYQQEISAYQPLQGKPKISRDAYIWGAGADSSYDFD